MDRIANVWFIDSHSKGFGRYQKGKFVCFEFALYTSFMFVPAPLSLIVIEIWLEGIRNCTAVKFDRNI